MDRRGRSRRRLRIGRPRSVERPPGFTRDQLLKAAAEVFAEKGFEKASLRTIASRAGVTSAAVYRHFAGKADLLLGVVEQAIHAMPLAERVEGGDVLVPRDFARLIASYAGPGFASLRRLAIEIHAAASRDPDAGRLLRSLNERVHRNLSAKLVECADAGHLPEALDADRVASLLVVLIMGLAHLETLAPDRIGDETWLEFLETAVAELLVRSRRTRE
jgi:AcrR family transcriptional regulator